MPDTQPEEDRRPFATFLMETNRGRTHRELTDALYELVAEVKRTGKPGAVSLAITVKPQAGNDGLVIVTDQITKKLPKGERGTSIFFVDNDGGLRRDDPNQNVLFYAEEKPAR
ncbi:hypothetical protein M8C13_04390 [Crossiella sp. SN42]|uniref:hypothetical protein n=1 Tax=Crossiella sp. SN42 TaxID=2944808 RepID=UPI00207CF52C|nr:hypothetical protein [Crossiella sp. SN42]MCO1574997.1 hypothetical protein [Crossiella sp. SN42]